MRDPSGTTNSIVDVILIISSHTTNRESRSLCVSETGEETGEEGDT